MRWRAENFSRRKSPSKESGGSASRLDRRPSPATAPPTIFLPLSSKAVPTPSRRYSILVQTRSYPPAILNGQRAAFRALEFAVAAEFFMTPTAELCDYVLPAASFLEMSNVTNDFKHRPQGKLHLQYRPAVVPPLAE